jgi:hypothetical protein
MVPDDAGPAGDKSGRRIGAPLDLAATLERHSAWTGRILVRNVKQEHCLEKHLLKRRNTNRASPRVSSELRTVQAKRRAGFGPKYRAPLRLDTNRCSASSGSLLGAKPARQRLALVVKDHTGSDMVLVVIGAECQHPRCIDLHNAEGALAREIPEPLTRRSSGFRPYCHFRSPGCAAPRSADQACARTFGSSW